MVPLTETRKAEYCCIRMDGSGDPWYLASHPKFEHVQVQDRGWSRRRSQPCQSSTRPPFTSPCTPVEGRQGTPTLDPA